MLQKNGENQKAHCFLMRLRLGREIERLQTTAIAQFAAMEQCASSQVKQQQNSICQLNKRKQKWFSIDFLFHST